MNDVKTYRLESSCFLLIRTIKLLLCLLVRVDFVGLVVVVVSTAFAKSTKTHGKISLPIRIVHGKNEETRDSSKTSSQHINVRDKEENSDCSHSFRCCDNATTNKNNKYQYQCTAQLYRRMESL